MYYNMFEDDVCWILLYLVMMVGLDGLLNDLLLYLWLWGVFLCVFGYYVCDINLLLFEEVICKMMLLFVCCYGILKCGEVYVGYYVDLVLFDLVSVIDVVMFEKL